MTDFPFYIYFQSSPKTREAVEAGTDLIEMEEKMRELIENGVPNVLALELSRQILDADIPESKPITIYEDESDREDSTEDENEDECRKG